MRPTRKNHERELYTPSEPKMRLGPMTPQIIEAVKKTPALGQV